MPIIDSDNSPVNGRPHGAAGRAPVTDFAAWEHSTLAKFAEEATARLVELDQQIAQLETDIKMLLKQLRDVYRK